MATHGMGGELTWTCLPTGEYKFQLKFYRDCNGISGSNSINLNTTVPGISYILMPLVGVNEISPTGFYANGITACQACGQISSPPVPGIIEEFIYQSAPVNLPGVPPTAGWIFSWGECCRSGALTNLMGGGSAGFLNRAIMYPYLGINTMPCFDSSPYFTEKPVVTLCTGYAAEMSINAVDSDMDSLVYNWANPLDDAGAVINFTPGYSLNFQLPSAIQNPLNVAATLDIHTGEINFTSYTSGLFVTTVKVTAYKCGIKVAEVFREIDVVLNNGCSPVLGNQPNNPPEVFAPFIDPVTGLQTSYSDTVNAGDTVNFVFAATDFDMFVNNSAQTITINGSGAQFGSNFTDPNAGCLIPPCATISSGLPVSFYVGGQVNFNWVTTCAHAQGNPSQCFTGPVTYTFVLSATDNYCPANARAIATISITVLGSAISISANGPASICQGDSVTLTATGSSNYTWSTGQTGPTIVVTQPGIYTVSGDSVGICSGTSLPFYVNPGIISNVTATIPQDSLCFYGVPEILTGSPSGGIWSGPGVNGNLFTPFDAGTGSHEIIYTFTDSAGCVGSDTLTVSVNVCTGIDDIVSNKIFSVHPNPANDNISISIAGDNDSDVLIQLFNVYGSKVMEFFSGKLIHYGSNQTFDISVLNKGVYFIKVSGDYAGTTKLIKY